MLCACVCMSVRFSVTKRCAHFDFIGKQYISLYICILVTIAACGVNIVTYVALLGKLAFLFPKEKSEHKTQSVSIVGV